MKVDHWHTKFILLLISRPITEMHNIERWGRDLHTQLLTQVLLHQLLQKHTQLLLDQLSQKNTQLLLNQLPQ